MSVDKFNPDLLKGFIAHDPKAVASKLRRFSAATTHMVADWDRTLTATYQHLDITSWGVVQKLLPVEALENYNMMEKKFLPKERAGKLTMEEAIVWWQDSLKLHMKYETKIHDIESAISSISLHPREGAVALFEACRFAGMPTVILSAGIRNVIQWMTETYGMEPTVILATHLLTDDNGRITGWDEETLVHFFNKQEIGHKELSVIRRRQPHAIMLGDTVEDAGMIDGTEDVIRIRVCDSHSCVTDKDKKTFHKNSFAAGYDLVVVDDLHPVVELVKWLSTKD